MRRTVIFKTGLFPLFGTLVVFFLVAVFFFAFSRDPSSVTTSVSVTPRAVHIGQDIKYSLKVQSPPGTELRFPVLEGKVRGLEVTGSDMTKDHFPPKHSDVASFYLRSFNPGKYYVPPLEIGYLLEKSTKWQRILTDGIYFRVIPVVKFDPSKELLRRVSMITESRMEEISETGQRGTEMEIDAPIRFPIRGVPEPKKVHTPKDIFLFFLAIFGGLLVILVILIVVFIFLTAAFRIKEPSLSEKYINELRSLKKQELINKGDKISFCEKLYSVITAYLKDKAGLHGKEMTTKEFLNFLETLKDLDSEYKDLIRERLRLCDLVKYSGYEPSPEELDPQLKSEIGMILALSEREQREEGT